MGRYLTEAKRHLEKIKHLVSNSGSEELIQYHRIQLGECHSRAHRSKNDQSDSMEIKLLIENANALFDDKQ